MYDSLLEYRGTFRFASHVELDRALSEVREHLEDVELDTDRGWLQYLSRRGMTIHVDAALPTFADRYVAAAVLGSLAEGAVEGCVDVTIGNQLVDAFVSRRDLL